MAHEVCVGMAPALSGRVMDWQVAGDFPALRGDAALLGQVLTHLFSNAAKFTQPRAAAEIRVTWQLHPSGQCAVTVADNGVGFNPQYTPKLFHAFQRLHGAREFEGMGMGLALTRKIIERHGGTVWADGVPNVGCSVSFTLPLA
jgi:signal transduction histidine kinase